MSRDYFNPFSDVIGVLNAALSGEAGRTLRWKPANERAAIMDFMDTHRQWVEDFMEFGDWRELSALYESDVPWNREVAAESRRLIAKLDLRVTVMLQVISLALKFPNDDYSSYGAK